MNKKLRESDVIKSEIDDLFRKKELVEESILSLIEEKDSVFKLIIEKEKELKEMKRKEVPRLKFLYNGGIYRIVYAEMMGRSVLVEIRTNEYLCIIDSNLSKAKKQNELHRLLKRRGLSFYTKVNSVKGN